MISSKEQQEINSLDTEIFRETGNKFFHSKQFREAASQYSSGIELIVRSLNKDNKTCSHLYHNRALCYTKMGQENSDQALADAKRATELDPKYVKAWMLCARLNSQILEAVAALHRVLELDLEHHEALDLLKSLVHLELKAKLDGAPPEMLSEKVDIAAAFQKFESYRNEDESNTLLVHCIQALFELQTNWTVLDPPLTESERVELIEEEAATYNAIGSLFLSLHNFCSVRSCCFLRYQLLNQLQQSPRITDQKVNCFKNLSVAYLWEGPEAFQVSTHWVERALQLLPVRDSEENIKLRLEIAQMNLFQNVYHSRTMESLRDCDATCIQKGYSELSAKSKDYMAAALNAVGNYEAALPVAEQAIAEYKKVGNIEGAATSTQRLSIALIQLERFDDAQHSLETALTVSRDPSNVIELTHMLGYLYWTKYSNCSFTNKEELANKFLKTAEKHLLEAHKQAVQIKNEWSQIKVDTCLASVYLEMDKSENRESLEAFIVTLIHKATKYNHPELSNLYAIYSRFLINRRKFSNAIDACLKADESYFKVISTLRSEEDILTRKHNFGLYINKTLQMCYAFNGKPDDALLVAERAKIKAFSMSSRNSNLQLSLDRFKEIANNINSCLIIINDVEVFLFCWIIFPNIMEPIKFFPFYYRVEHLKELKYNKEQVEIIIKHITLEEIQNDEMVCQFRKFPLSPEKNPNLKGNNIKKESHMFESVFKNIEPELASKGCTSLVLVPDGEQYNAKFASAKCSDNSPLIFKYTLSVCPTIGLISDSHAYLNNDAVVTPINSIENKIMKALIIGDPQQNLPFADDEAKILQTLFEEKSNWEPTVFIGSNAQKKKIVEELVNCKLIHIASHADLSTDSLMVLRGSIILAPSLRGIHKCLHQ